jgi:hypothetical protein
MDQFLDFLKFAVPMGVVVGGSFSVVSAVFKLHWRVAVVENRSVETQQRVTKMEDVCESVTRIEENIKELLRDRRRTHGAAV